MDAAMATTMNEITDPEVIRRILHERAKALARPPERDESGESLSLMVATVGNERYGIDIVKVQEVKPLAHLTPVPHTPLMWAGVVNMRGSLYPILDLRRYLALPETEKPEDPKAVIVSGAGITAGLLVEDIPEVRRVRLADILPPLADSGQRDVLRGVTEDLLNVLDVEALLADPSLVVKDELE
jgi:purine-binding chemotaxis protein CheW